MPREWRSPERWFASPNVWRRAERARKRAAIVGAFVDRTSIDWSAALRHAADPAEWRLVEGLRRLESLHAARDRCARERLADPRVWPLAIATALGMAQVVCALALCGLALASGAPPVSGSGVQLPLVAAFAIASLLLSAAAIRDDRAYLLLATFVLAASAFAHSLIGTTPHGSRLLATPVFRGLYPEVFLSATLWELAAVFPFVQRFTAVDVFTRRAASLAWIVAAGVCVVNLMLAYAPGAVPGEVLGRNNTGHLYWRVFAATAWPAIGIILVRAHRAPRSERLKVVRFAGALAAGAGPFLLMGVARSIPTVDAWSRSVAVRAWMDIVVLVPLGALPVLTSIAVLVDRPFEPQAVNDNTATAVRRWLDRSWSFIGRRLRRRRVREQLSLSLDRLRLARGSRELIAVLDRELRIGAGAGTAVILTPEALPSGTALAPLLADAGGPIDLSRDCEPFLLLPLSDRDWLEAERISLATAVRLQDGTLAAVVLLGHPRAGDGFGRIDRWFITALVTTAAAAWPPADPPADPEDPADECAGCGRIRAPGEPPCCADATTKLASLPVLLSGKYSVTRRLGSGGMGVVYLGHDRTLGRDVALKTLPGLQEEAVVRLRAEAHVMAALDHPAIATIYGVEVWRGTPVLVLEYCPRGTLADALARGGLTVDEVLRLGVQLADALAHVHARGMLHRDVKPGNIGFTSNGAVKLLDFGLTGADHHAAGTPAYLPPEVFAGAAPGVAVDLWGLATVLREACAPDDRLSAFLARALARRPADRYRTSREVGAALRQLTGT